MTHPTVTQQEANDAGNAVLAFVDQFKSHDLALQSLICAYTFLAISNSCCTAHAAQAAGEISTLLQGIADKRAAPANTHLH